MTNERSRAWRRFRDRINAGRGMGCAEPFKPEKLWKHMYTRSEKMVRAKQLGFEYPRKSVRQLLDAEMTEDRDGR